MSDHEKHHKRKKSESLIDGLEQLLADIKLTYQVKHAGKSQLFLAPNVGIADQKLVAFEPEVFVSYLTSHLLDPNFHNPYNSYMEDQAHFDRKASFPPKRMEEIKQEVDRFFKDQDFGERLIAIAELAVEFAKCTKAKFYKTPLKSFEYNSITYAQGFEDFKHYCEDKGVSYQAVPALLGILVEAVNGLGLHLNQAELKDRHRLISDKNGAYQHAVQGYHDAIKKGILDEHGNNQNKSVEQRLEWIYGGGKALEDAASEIAKHDFDLAFQINQMANDMLVEMDRRVNTSFYNSPSNTPPRP